MSIDLESYKTCDHVWEQQTVTYSYNSSGRYVNGHGWELMWITKPSNRYRCNKCKAIKEVVDGKDFIYGPLPNPDK